jgi:hypothetical protein
MYEGWVWNNEDEKQKQKRSLIGFIIRILSDKIEKSEKCILFFEIFF